MFKPSTSFAASSGRIFLSHVHSHVHPNRVWCVFRVMCCPVFPISCVFSINCRGSTPPASTILIGVLSTRYGQSCASRVQRLTGSKSALFQNVKNGSIAKQAFALYGSSPQGRVASHALGLRLLREVEPLQDIIKGRPFCGRF